MPVVVIILGVLLLLFGRSLYWAFVAAAGFLVGAELAAELLAEQAEWVRLLAAVLVGAVGAIVGIVAQRLAFAVGGFFAGGYLGMAVAQSIEGAGEPLVWFVVAGVIGAIVAAVVMDWAIILLSSLAGAAAIVEQLQLEPTIAAAALVGLAVVGMAVQGRRLRRAAPIGRPIH